MSKGRKKQAEFELSRRQAIGTFGLLGAQAMRTSPIVLFIQSVIDGMINDVLAQEAGVDPRYFVHLFMRGGPARWMFDVPLQPLNQGILPNSKMVGTKFNFSDMTNNPLSYSSVAVPGSKYFAPSLWEKNVMTSGGAVDPKIAILKHTLMFRGALSNNAGHGDAVPRTLMPSPGGTSVEGAVADRARTPIPSTLLGYPNTLPEYRSKSGISRFAVDYSAVNPLAELLKPFSIAANSPLKKSAAVEAAFETAISALGNLDTNGNQNFGARVVYRDRLNAKSLMKKNFEILTQSYVASKQTYLDLFNNALRDRAVPGITDQIVPGANNVLCRVNTVSGDGNVTRTGPGDLRSVFQANSQMEGLAEGLAISQFLIKENLSSSMIFSGGSLSNLLFPDPYTDDKTGGLVRVGTPTNYNMYFDQHATGGIATLLLNGMMYRGLMSCLAEFVAQLKSAGKFNDTVIHLGAEFPRFPETDGSGSQHGNQGINLTTISGAINSFKVLGNISNSGGNGTWGRAATVDNLQGREANLGNIASTLCHLLRVQTPSPNDMSVVQETAGDIVSTVGEPKNV